MRQTIALQQVPNQIVTTAVGGQTITLNLYTANELLFCDLYLGTTLVESGLKCNQGSYINQYTSDFIGYLFFWDTTDAEPLYSNFGITTTLNYSDTDLISDYFDTWLLENPEVLQ